MALFLEKLLSLEPKKTKGEETMKTIFTIFLAVALTAGLASFMATDAGANTVVANGDGVCSSDELAAGECFVTTGGWSMEIVPVVDSKTNNKVFPFYCDGTTTNDVKDVNGQDACKDKHGPIHGSRFAYIIKAPTATGNYSLAQANVLCEKCNISKTYPTDNSIQILDSDPNSKYWFPDNYVVAINSLKLDPSNQEDIVFYLTWSGAGKKAALLWTGTGPEKVDTILGPVCCEKTQVPTEIKVEFLTGCSGTPTVDNFFAEYDPCSGDATGVYRKDSSGNKVYFDPIDAYICEGDQSGYDRNSCISIKMIGPREGAVIFAGYQYFGYGSKIYRGPATDPTCLTQSYCPADADPGAPFKPSKTIDERTVFEFDQCGYVTDFTDTEGRSYGRVTAWICEATANGGINSKMCSRILGGSTDGAIVYANPTYCVGGTYVTTATCSSSKPCPYGQTCSSGSCYCRSNSQCPSGKTCRYVFSNYGVCK